MADLVCNPLGSYPNAKDNHNTPYINLNLDPQATRIYLRSVAGQIGFPNSTHSPDVIFLISAEMSKMYVFLGNWNDYLLKMRKLAINQTLMEAKTGTHTYSGKGFYDFWKEGNLVPMKQGSSANHTSLFQNVKINPFKLSQPLWWALMMSMLGIFQEQLETYRPALTTLNIELTEEAFLKYICDNYRKYVDGNLQFITIQPRKNSIFSLCEFPEGEPIFELGDHGVHGECKTKSWFSQSEMDRFLTERMRCPWCRYASLNRDSFSPVTTPTNRQLLENAYSNARPLTIKPDCPSMISEMAIPVNTALSAGEAVLGTVFSNMRISPSSAHGSGNYIKIDNVGPTGAGKTYSTEMMTNILLEMGTRVLVISADKWSKQGLVFSEVQNAIFSEINEFMQNPSTVNVIISDICHDRKIEDTEFGFRYDRSIWKTVTFCPNLYDNYPNKIQQFQDYCCWCLNNLLNRPLHSDTSNFWLNKHSAGLEVVVNVHNGKCNGIIQNINIPGFKKPKFHRFDPKLTEDQLKASIQDGCSRYAQYLNDLGGVAYLRQKIRDFLTALIA
jgi:hypothetical protein